MIQKTVEDKQGSGYILQIYQSKDEIRKHYKEIERSVTPLSEKVGINTGDYIHHWLGYADSVALVVQSEKVLGFAAAAYYSNEIIYTPILVLDPEVHNRGVMSILTRYIIRTYFSRKIQQLKIHPFDIFRSAFILFRTDNPRLYSILNRKFILYPSASGSKIGKNDIGLIKKAVNSIWPKAKFDEDRFILKNEFHDQREFFKNGIPWSGDKAVDQFFEDRLQLTRYRGNALVVVVKLNFSSLLKFLT